MVLTTTVDAEVCADADILQAYQDQNTIVEPGFRWIKTPQRSPRSGFSRWLEKPERYCGLSKPIRTRVGPLHSCPWRTSVRALMWS